MSPLACAASLWGWSARCPTPPPPLATSAAPPPARPVKLFIYFVQFGRISFKMFSSCELVNVLHLLLFLSLTVPICLSQAVTKLWNLLFQSLTISIVHIDFFGTQIQIRSSASTWTANWFLARVFSRCSVVSSTLSAFSTSQFWIEVNWSTSS